MRALDLDAVSEVLARVRRAKTEAKLSQRAPVSPASSCGPPPGPGAASRRPRPTSSTRSTVAELVVDDGDELERRDRRRLNSDPPVDCSTHGCRWIDIGPAPPDAGRSGSRSARTIVAAVVCFLTAGGLAAGYMVLRSRDVVEITNPAERAAGR